MSIVDHTVGYTLVDRIFLELNSLCWQVVALISWHHLFVRFVCLFAGVLVRVVCVSLVASSVALCFGAAFLFAAVSSFFALASISSLYRLSLQ